MKITVIYGTGRRAKSSTYNIAQQFIKLLARKDEVTEFFLPESMPKFCIGCRNCFTDFIKCPDYMYLKPILESMLDAELLVFTAPVYVSHVPGQVKAFLDHFGYQTMAHQPRKEMFGKRALLITTAAGGGTKSALRDLKDGVIYWGVSRIYSFGVNVHSGSWDTVDEKLKQRIWRKIDRLSQKIKTGDHSNKPSLKIKGLFYFMRFIYKTVGRRIPLERLGYTAADIRYWNTHGWLEKERPWSMKTGNRIIRK